MLFRSGLSIPQVHSENNDPARTGIQAYWARRRKRLRCFCLTGMVTEGSSDRCRWAKAWCLHRPAATDPMLSTSITSTRPTAIKNTHAIRNFRHGKPARCNRSYDKPACCSSQSHRPQTTLARPVNGWQASKLHWMRQTWPCGSRRNSLRLPQPFAHLIALSISPIRRVLLPPRGSSWIGSAVL